MRAARFYTAGDLRVEDVPEPAGALGPYDVLLRNRICGICGTDLHEYRHGPFYTTPSPQPEGFGLPAILGHEFSAVVEAVGADVRRVRPGDRVAIQPQVYCGRCAQCAVGRQYTCQNLEVVGLLTWPWGGFAERAVVPEEQVTALPDDMSDDAGALVEPAAVAVHAVESVPLRPGDAVLVTGGGPIGQLVALAASSSGAGAVVLSEPNRHRRERAASLGLTAVVDPAETDPGALMRELTDGAGADACLECAGSQAALDACLAAVRLGGTIVQTAFHGRPVQVDADALTIRDVAIRGVCAYPVTSWPRIIRMIASGRLPVERIVTGRIGLDDVVSAGFETLLEPDSAEVKILVSA